MSKQIVVGIADQKIAHYPDILVSYALGSCVGVCLYDSILRIGGLAHILLPDSKMALNGDVNEYKFADTAIQRLLYNLEAYGCSRYRLVAKISGGSNMFISQGKSVGKKNIEAVKRELARLHIKIVAEDTGGNHGRTLEFHTTNGSLIVKSVAKGNIEI